MQPLVAPGLLFSDKNVDENTLSRQFAATQQVFTGMHLSETDVARQPSLVTQCWFLNGYVSRFGEHKPPN